MARVNLRGSNLDMWGASGSVVACLLLSTAAAFAASPDQLYQTWQKNFLTDPAVSEKAAEDYLRAAPQGATASTTTRLTWANSSTVSMPRKLR